MAERFTIPRKCSTCKNDFTGRDKSGVIARYCSRKCFLMTVHTKEHQVKAGIAGSWYGKSIRGTGKNGYVKYYGKHQHRVVMEQHLGRKLEHDEIVHHIDDNKHNNHISNLQVMTRAEHIKHHIHDKH